MQDTSSLYKSILTNDYFTNVKIVINNSNTYFMDKIISVKTNRDIVDNDNKIGGVVSSQIDLVMIKPNVTFPKMAKIQLYCQIAFGNQESEWIPQGTYYIDTRKTDYDSDKNYQTLTIHGYDILRASEQTMYLSNTNVGSWPKTDIQVVNIIANRLGISVDQRTTTLMNKAYQLSLPYVGNDGLTIREVLSVIANMYLGNWIITDENKLRLIETFVLPGETYYLIDSIGNSIVFGSDRILV